MVNRTVLGRAGWLAAVATLLALTGCRDFDRALADCFDAGRCIPDEPDSGTNTDSGTPTGNDGGMDGGTTPGNDAGDDGGTLPIPDAGDDGGTLPIPDAGSDGGPLPLPDAGDDAGPLPLPDAGDDAGPLPDPDAGTPDAGLDSGTVVVTKDAGAEADAGFACESGMCLRDQYTLDGPYEFQGLWASEPDDVFLAARARPEAQAPAQVVRFQDGRFSATTVDLAGFQPFRLQGTGPDNLWAINETPVSGPCWPGNEPLSGAVPGPLLHCPSPVFRFDGQRWAPVDSVTNGPFTIQPPALYTGPDATWVAGSGDGVLRWTGSMWLQEPVGMDSGDQLSALWGDSSGLRLGVGSDSHHLGVFRQRTSWGAWFRAPSLEANPFIALAGPDEKNLYAATSSELLRWMPGDWWQPEMTVPSLHGETPAVQDIWVSADGSDVWVTLKTDYVLRKHGGQWSVISLPVEPGFSALQVEGFDTPQRDLWITGTWSSGPLPGTSAYHYELQEP